MRLPTSSSQRAGSFIGAPLRSRFGIVPTQPESTFAVPATPTLMHIAVACRMPAMSKQKPSFEEALQRLERIVAAIEQGEVGLEESIKQFDEGMRLIQHCRGILADAELKIQRLQSAASGALEPAPFEPPPAPDAAADDEVDR